MADDIRMIKGSEVRKADHQIEPFLIDRWSPRAMSGEETSREELMRLFEAARWAPSSFNAQQWRALYARRGTEHWQTFFDLLVDANKTWAKNAAAPCHKIWFCRGRRAAAASTGHNGRVCRCWVLVPRCSALRKAASTQHEAPRRVAPAPARSTQHRDLTSPVSDPTA